MLTELEIRSAKPKQKPYKLTDGKGLYLEVMPTGRKFWRYRFEVQEGGVRKESRITLGEHVSAPSGEKDEDRQRRMAGGFLTASEAREERLKARALVKQGISPVQQRHVDRLKADAMKAHTLRSVTDEWLALQGWEPITKKRTLQMLERVVYPQLGDLPLSQITGQMILDVLKTSASTNGVTVMAQARRTLFKVFRFGEETFRVSVNPVLLWENSLPKNKTQLKESLSPDEVGRLLLAVSRWGGRYETVNAFMLMWWTLCRSIEACEAKWSEFDLDAGLWRIPADRMKARREHVSPLPRQALQMLEAMKPLTGRGEFVFGNRDARYSKPMPTGTFRQMLKALGWSGKYSPHGTRVTGSTILNGLGYRVDAIEAQLAHADQNKLRAVYNKQDYLMERREMLQAWADLLDKWRSAAKDVPDHPGGEVKA